MQKRIFSLFLALTMILSLLPNLSEQAFGAENSDTYTYDTSLTTVPTNWSPMSWSSESDDFVRTYIQTPLVDLTVKDSSTGEYQWAFLGATSITNLTESGGVGTPRVYEIALNSDLCWEDGTPINADSYIWSMQQILDPDMQYPNAKTFYSGIAALAGAEAYALGGTTVLRDNGLNEAYKIADLVKAEDGSYTTPDGGKVYIAVDYSIDWLGGNTLADYVNAYGTSYFGTDTWEDLIALADENGLVPLTDDSLALLTPVTTGNPAWGETEVDLFNYLVYEQSFPKADWSTVGLTKVDDYTIRYSCVSMIGYFDFLSFCCNNTWLIHPEMYEACKASGTYGTTVGTTMSYGPYKLQSADANKLVLVRNSRHFESNVTSFKVDGSYVPQWQMDTIAVHVMTKDESLRSFLEGDLDCCEINASQAVTYIDSPARYQAAQDTTWCLYLNTNLETLQEIDANYGGTNSAVLSNPNFRKAFSLCVDRAGVNVSGQVQAPVLGLFSDAYYPGRSPVDHLDYSGSEIYRRTDFAMEAMCELYGVKYGSGTAYATLEEAYESITGYDPAQARKLMALACDELVAAGLYTKGEPIVLTFSCAYLTDIYRNIIERINEILNEAIQGSGFGAITVMPHVTGENWRNDVKQGKAAMCMAGWSGDAMDPFGMMEAYIHPDFSSVPLSLDTKNELLTLNISGQDYTMTWWEWLCKLLGYDYDGYLNYNEEVLAKLENAYLKQYIAIPMYADAQNYLMSYQVKPYTDLLSSLYGFGGLRLMTFKYNDAEWEDYIASGALNYESSVKPDAPTVKIGNVASTGKIKLTWDAVEGASKYQVWRSTDKENWTLLKTVTGTSLTNTSAEAGKLYYYYVVAVDAGGNTSDPSAIVSRCCDLPRPVITLSNVASSGKVKITWEKIEGAVKYEVYRSTDNKNWSKLSTTTGTSLTNTSTTAGTLYYYKVKAIASNSNANSAFSTVKSRRCDLARPTISSLTIISSTGKIKVKWGAVEGAVKYELYCSTDNVNWTKLTTTTGTAINHNSAVAGTRYYYKVRAIASNSEANSAYSAVKNGTCDLARPTLTVKLNSKDKPYLTWTKVTGAVKYEVYRSTDNKTWTKLSTTTGTKLTHSSAVSGTTYYYKVRAIASNTAANSAYSTVKSVKAG